MSLLRRPLSPKAETRGHHLFLNISFAFLRYHLVRMTKNCRSCGLVNFSEANVCIRCGSLLVEAKGKRRSSTPMAIVTRAVICLVVCCLMILGFYVSLVSSAKPLSPEQGYQARRAIALLHERGFGSDIFILEHFSIFRGEDNWLNASVPKENAYAATNFPFEIITLYSDFFTYPVDDRITKFLAQTRNHPEKMLHESRHLRGKDEHDAYKFVWEHRQQLGWTKDKYRNSVVWRNVRKQTRETVPELFVCDFNDLEVGDCTEE